MFEVIWITINLFNIQVWPCKALTLKKHISDEKATLKETNVSVRIVFIKITKDNAKEY